MYRVLKLLARIQAVIRSIFLAEQVEVEQAEDIWTIVRSV